VIKITTIYHLLACRFLFTKESSLETVGIPQYQSPILPSQRSNSSRVLNRQIKAALHLLLKEWIPEALLELDGRLRHQEKEMWTSCLCAHLLLCTCVEQIQVAVDAFILSNLSSEGDPGPIRHCGLDISRSLEKRTLEHSQLLLDGLLKGIIKKHNPFEAGAQMNDEEAIDEVGLNEAERTLANELQQITNDHSKVSSYRSKMAANASQRRR
jgi:hypothetical protein